MSVLAFGFLADSLADPADTAYIPFKINVAAHVSAAAQGESDVTATLNVTANTPSQSAKARAGLNSAPLMQNARGKVSLNLPAARRFQRTSVLF
jgi:hypothetical protein